MKNNHIQHAVKFGVILGSLRVLLDVSFKVLNVSAMQYNLSSIYGLIIEIILIVMAIFMYRNTINNQLLSIGEALKIGVIMMIITSAFLFLAVNFYHPEFGEEKAIAFSKLYQPEKLQETLENIRVSKENPAYLVGFAVNILNFMFSGLIISFIIGIVLSKKE